MMNPLPIVLTNTYAPSESPVSVQTGTKPRRTFSLRLLKKSSKDTPSAVVRKHQASELVSQDTRCTPSATKKNELLSPLILKRKYLRQVKLPPLPQLSVGKGRKAAANEVPTAVTPSTFEQELADQENQSPNDPEFVRRASERWRRRTGARQLQPPLQLLLQNTASQQPTFEWSSSPRQKRALQWRGSPRPIHCDQAPLGSVPTSPLLGPSPFRRCNTNYSSLHKAPTESTFNRSSRSYSSFTSISRPRVYFGLGDQSPQSPSMSPKLGRLLVSAVKSVSPNAAPGKLRGLSGRLALDDTVAEEVKKAAKKEKLLADTDEPSLKAPFRRISARLRRSLRCSRYSNSATNSCSNVNNCNNSSIKKNRSFCNSSSNSISSNISNCSNDVAPTELPSFTTSASCQSFFSSSSGYASDYSSHPSSPTILPRETSALPDFTMTAILAGPVTLQDIFVDEPQIAEKFAIMFPTEPRPEWHRHLRQVLNKAGQKIFKKGEPHETTIPENLRHQLKHIYVY